MPSLPLAPALDAEAIGRPMREAEAALCRVHAAALVLLPMHLARRAAEPLHALGLARAASVGLVDDSKAFYLAPPAKREGPECVAAPWLPEHPRDATPEHWARLKADVEAADRLVARLVKAFGRHPHAADRWGDVMLALDDFWGGALASRVTLMAESPPTPPRKSPAAAKPRATRAGRPLGRGPLVSLEVL